MNPRFRHPLSLQTVLPDDYESNGDFGSLLELLRELGFWGVELNVGDPADHPFEAVRRFLGRHGLRLSMLATGLAARRLGLSLSHPDEGERRRAVDKCKEMIGWVGDSGTGVIVGLLKGGPSPDPDAARRRFAASLESILPAAAARRVPVLVEATNRYETAVANTLEEAASLVEGHDARWAQILPDTFHMNIEETDAPAALRAHRGRIASLHLSDNNRRFPGFGAIDFGRIASALDEIGFRGRLAIEGNAPGDLRGDLRATIHHLTPFFGG